MDRLALILMSFTFAQDPEVTREKILAEERAAMQPVEVRRFTSLLPPMNAEILNALSLPDPPPRVESAGSVSAAGLSHKVPKKARQAYDRATKHTAAARHAQAAQELEQAIQIDPEYAQAYNNLGAQYYMLGRFEDARAAVRKAVQLDPGLVGAHVNLANFALAQADWETAQVEAQRVLALGGQREEALRILRAIEAGRKR